jgi:hypothetical protein
VRTLSGIDSAFDRRSLRMHDENSRGKFLNVPADSSASYHESPFLKLRPRGSRESLEPRIEPGPLLLEQSFVAQIGGHDPQDCLLVCTATPG